MKNDLLSAWKSKIFVDDKQVIKFAWPYLVLRVELKQRLLNDAIIDTQGRNQGISHVANSKSH